METVMIKKEYEKMAKLISHKKKVLYYCENEILLYRKPYGIHIPTLEDHIENNPFNIQLQESILEPIVQIVSCSFVYQAVNNKLIKQYLKYIKDYYMYGIQFDANFKGSLEPIYKNDEILKPVILTVEDAIQYINRIGYNRKDKQIVLERFAQKRKNL